MSSIRWIALALLAAAWLIGHPARAAEPAAWPTYLFDNARDNAVQDGRSLASGTVHVDESWSLKLGGPIVSSPAIEGNTAYVPSWDGNLYAIDLTSHALIWKRFLGTQNTWIGPAGVSSPPAFAADIGPHGAVLVGGGGKVQSSDSHLYFYALDALSGDVLWRTVVGGARGDSIFDSPLYLGGHIYFGTAGSGGIQNAPVPPRAGFLYELDGKTGAVLHRQSMAVPHGTGGAIWGSVATTADGSRILIPTGDGANPSVQHLVEGVVAVDSSSLHVVDHWQVPAARESIPDNDFGGSVTVFSDGVRTLVGAMIKSGTYYTLDATNLKHGPVWHRQLGNTGSGNQYVQATSAAFAAGPQYPGGRALFVAAPNVKIKGKDAKGGVFALNPANGKIIWAQRVDGIPQEGAITVYDDSLIIPEQQDFFQNVSGGTIEVRSVSDGRLLAAFPTAGTPFSPPVVIDGTMYFGTTDGLFHAVSIQ